ncbi:MAG: hypothetical protein U5J63_13620 [Fodinibius sp.]|nr:hypothetical protein [Fodinibius sp.]
MHITEDILLVLIVILLSFTTNLEAQTCSCAGAPLISSQSVSSVSQGNLFAGLTYQYKNISKLYSGSNQVDNVTTKRNTQSTLLEINYGISDRFTISGTATYVRKYLKTGLQKAGISSKLVTNGIGDGIVMLKYVLHQNTIREQYQLALGGGVKAPIGQSNLKSNELTLNADMQPGSGAWDGVAWGYFSKSFAPASTINAFLYGNYRYTGTNERFGANDSYSFGNQWIVNAGITNKIIPKLSYTAIIRLRSMNSDHRNGNAMPNTGGEWINLRPALTYQVANGLSLKVAGKIPVYQRVNGLQPTTAYSTSLSVFYNFGNNVIF